MTNPLGDLISRGEGGYNSYNRGTQHGRIVPANQDHDFSQMTIRELLRRQALPITDADKVFAAGKYQIIPTTMRDAVSKLHLGLDESYTPQMQERIFADFLIRDKRPPLHAYISGQAGASLHSAQKAAAQEWASIDDPDTPGHPYGTYGRHGNRSSIRAGQVAGALDRMRDAYQADMNRGMSPQDAWRSVTGQVAVSQAGPVSPHQPEVPIRHLEPHRQNAQSQTHPVVQYGDQGPQVHELQQVLSRLNYRDPGGHALAVDGDFGRNTQHAVEQFQREHGLSVDGVAGKDTWRVLTATQANPFTSRYHPHHALYGQALDKVHAEESRRHIDHGPHSELLAGALTMAAVRHGLARIDRVELNDKGDLVRAVQVSSTRDEPGLNRVTDPLGTRQATQQSLHHGNEQVQQPSMTRQLPQPSDIHHAQPLTHARGM